MIISKISMGMEMVVTMSVNEKKNPLSLSGTKVTDGYGYMLVTSVCMNTVWGEMMGSVRRA